MLCIGHTADRSLQRFDFLASISAKANANLHKYVDGNGGSVEELGILS